MLKPQDDGHIALLASLPPIALLGAVIESLFYPSPGQSAVLLVFVLASPVLIAWLVWRLLRTDA